MNNKFLITILSVFILISTGCSKYLDRTPLDENSDATNWTSEAALETYAWNLYENFAGYGSGWTRGQYLSNGLTDDYCPDGYTFPTNNVPSSSSSWSDPYEEIRKANLLLNRVDIVPNLSEEAANHWRGIARFFRGMEHFELVKTYGDVVWVDTEIDIDDTVSLNKARDPRVDVMKKVCEDLQFAAANCRYTTDNTVNNMCANALLARAALFEGAWQKYHANNTENAKYFYEIAKNAANAVINSGYYTIHNDYLSNYISKDLKGNTEMILFKAYSHTSEGAPVTLAHAMQGWSNSSSKSWGLTKSAVESFANADGLPIYMGTYSDATVEDVFTDRDARLSLICDPELLCPVGWAWKEGVNSSTGYYVDKLVDWNDYGTTTWLAPANTTDAPVYSYSEVLVNYAEACAELEDIGGASMSQADLDKSINIVRRQHGNLPALTYGGGGSVSVNGVAITKDPKNKYNVSNLLWEIRRERRSELMCDGFRYDDLRRWKLGSLIDFASNAECYEGASKEAIEAFIEATKGEELYKDKKAEEVWAGNFWSTDSKYMSAFDIVKNNRVFEEKHYLEPIPSTERTLNPKLTQNPGW